MIGILYVLISSVTLYVQVRVKWHKVKEEITQRYITDLWIESPTFWIILATSFLWPLLVPVNGVIWVLDQTIGKVVDKFQKKL